VLSMPFRASLRDRPCAGDWMIVPRTSWSPAHRPALVGAQTVHASPTDSTATMRHCTRLHSQPSAVISADAVHRVACRGLLALASLSRRVAVELSQKAAFWMQGFKIIS
jgi:hypothetical protein